jgi:Fe2+ or Zn2+ uptake regulation protein
MGTTSQEVIIKEVIERYPHLNAETIYKKVKRRLPQVSLGTIYRNLNKLFLNSEINYFENGNNTYYELKKEPHGHLICSSCHKIKEVKEVSAKTPKSFKIKNHSIVIVGICKNCQ